MDPTILASLGSSVMDNVSNVGSSVLGYLGVKQTNKTNMQIAQDATKYDYQKWNEMNTYNSPTEQMKRLKAANLNPNLVYGTGNVTGTTTSSPPSARVAHVENELANMNLGKSGAMDVLGAFQDYRMKDATIDKIQADTEYTNIRKSNEDIRAWILGYDRDMKAEDAKVKGQLNQSQVEIQEQKALEARTKNQDLLPHQIEKAKQDARWQKSEADLQEKLKGAGATTKDSILARQFMMFLQFLKESKGVQDFTGIKFNKN